MSIMLDTYPESLEVDSPQKFWEILLFKKLSLLHSMQLLFQEHYNELPLALPNQDEFPVKD
jgi:hypothetical protein